MVDVFALELSDRGARVSVFCELAGGVLSVYVDPNEVITRERVWEWFESPAMVACDVYGDESAFYDLDAGEVLWACLRLADWVNEEALWFRSGEVRDRVAGVVVEALSGSEVEGVPVRVVWTGALFAVGSWEFVDDWVSCVMGLVSDE